MTCRINVGFHYKEKQISYVLDGWVSRVCMQGVYCEYNYLLSKIIECIHHLLHIYIYIVNVHMNIILCICRHIHLLLLLLKSIRRGGRAVGLWCLTIICTFSEYKLIPCRISQHICIEIKRDCGESVYKTRNLYEPCLF